MDRQPSLLPLLHQFDKDGYLKDTTYWETDASKENDYYLVFNNNYYALLLPEAMDKWEWLVEIVEAETVIITKGNYNGKNDCFELMFCDNIDTPFSIILSNEQVSCESPLREGWHGHLDIYTGGLYDCRNYFDRVYYRVANTLPFGKPVERQEIISETKIIQAL